MVFTHPPSFLASGLKLLVLEPPVAIGVNNIPDNIAVRYVKIPPLGFKFLARTQVREVQDGHQGEPVIHNSRKKAL